MIEVGRINTLSVVKIVQFGAFLDGGDEYGNILLPNRYKPKELAVGDRLAVFIYLDSEDEIIATTEKPLVMVGEFALLKIVSTTSIGAFAAWGLSKDLLIPFSEQRYRFNQGDNVFVHVYIDSASQRIVGTTKLNRFLDQTPANYRINQAVDLQIAEITDLGYKAIINGEHWGLLFKQEAFGRLFVSKKMTGYIKEIREDGKINLSLQALGRDKVLNLEEKIMDALERENGYIALSDKSSPADIMAKFQTSKGTYKKTIGHLMKQKKILIEKEGIRLIV